MLYLINKTKVNALNFHRSPSGSGLNPSTIPLCHLHCPIWIWLNIRPQRSPVYHQFLHIQVAILVQMLHFFRLLGPQFSRISFHHGYSSTLKTHQPLVSPWDNHLHLPHPHHHLLGCWHFEPQLPPPHPQPQCPAVASLALPGWCGCHSPIPAPRPCTDGKDGENMCV